MRSLLLLSLISFILVVVATSSGCERTYRSLADSLYLVTGTEYYYDLKQVDDKYFLPYVLEEVSGLTYYKNKQVIMINDEEGRIFIYDLDKRDIDRAIRFEKGRDYEGIEVVGEKVYVVDSDGDIFVFEIGDEKQVEADKIETPLSKDNDIEGLGYDPDRNRLMLACKGDSDIDDKDIKGQAVFGYDLDQEDFKKDPEFIITRTDLKEFFEDKKDQAYDEGKITFRPSGIALHPIEKKWYLIASVGKLLVVVNLEGEIEAAYPIPPRVLSQPEGICFLPNGDMLLSSEGEGDKGYIVQFKMQKRP